VASSQECIDGDRIAVPPTWWSGAGRPYASRVDSDKVAHAIRLSPEAQLRLRKAAGIASIDLYGDESPEPDTRDQTRSLTGLDFDDLVKEGEILSRRPYVCAVCEGTFTVEQFHRVRHEARIRGEPNPFTSGQEVHEECST